MRMFSLLAIAAGLACAPMFGGAAPATDGAATGPAAIAPSPDKRAFIDDLVGRMTLDEKIGQLRLISIGPEMPPPS